MLLSRPVAAVVVAALLVAAGCGDDSGGTPSAETARTVTVTRTVKEVAPKPRKRQRRASSFRACDANIRARVGTTTCEFAQNVFYEFWQATDAGEDDDVTAYSPVTKRDYDMDCIAGSTVVCKGGDGSEVRFGMAAIDTYDASQARRYACSHRVSALDVSGCVEEDEESPELLYRGGGDDGSGCDPNYAGACLDPSLSDYDCEDGEGDGPGYTGYVNVVGEDIYDLDRDGNGVACDW